MGLKFYLFGELRIIQGEYVLPALPFRVQNLLSLLLLRPQMQRREQIGTFLCPDSPPEQGRRHVSDLLYHLRKALPEATLNADRECIYIDPASRWLDVEQFRKYLASWDIECWSEGIDLYQGDLLISSYEDWLLEEREVLRLGFVTMAHQLCESLVEQHAYQKAMPVAERLLREEPYDEQALRRLMLIYQAMGRRGFALQVYEHFTDLIKTDLDIEPEPSTKILAQTIRDACPISYARDLQEIRTADDAEALLGRAYVALNRGQRAMAEALLTQLEQRPESLDKASVQFFEIDLALRFDELERAARILTTCDLRQPQALVRSAELAMAQRSWDKARSGSESVLLLANSTADRCLEARALWVIANAESQMGRRSTAYRAGERALDLSRNNSPPEHIIDSLTFLGRLLVTEGRFSQVGTYLSEALVLARRYDYPVHYAEAMRLSGWANVRAGRLLAAKSDYEEALNTCRNVGLPKREARLLAELAESCDLLGLSQRSLSLLKEAEAILSQFDDPMPVAINHYNQVFTYLYLDDAGADRAASLALSALSVFRQNRQVRWVARGLVALGYAQWIGGQNQKALEALGEALQLHDELNEPEKFCEILALQAQAHLELGQLSAALACSEKAVLSLTQGSRATDMQVDVYFAHAAALQANDHSDQAENYLRRAYAVLLEIAADLQDETARQAFFSRGPITRRLMREIYVRDIAQPSEVGTETRWLESRRGSQTGRVTWMVDAGPADIALKQAKGAIAVRRARLIRLIQQAETQGIHPKDADLAKALGVSTRTIQRDLAHIRYT